MSAPASLSRESRCLRLGGIGLVIASIVAFAIFEDAVDPLQFFRSADTSNLVWIALVCAAIANVFAPGLVLLLAGLREMEARGADR
jgi:hypothetical protein